MENWPNSHLCLEFFYVPEILNSFRIRLVKSKYTAKLWADLESNLFVQLIPTLPDPIFKRSLAEYLSIGD